MLFDMVVVWHSNKFGHIGFRPIARSSIQSTTSSQTIRYTPMSMTNKKEVVLCSLLNYFSENKFLQSASSLKSEAKVTGCKHAYDLGNLYLKSTEQTAKKLKTESNDSDSSDSDSSSSDSDSSDSDSSSSDSDSSSSDSDSNTSTSSSDSSDDESVDICQKRMDDMKKKAEEAKKAAEDWAKNISPPNSIKKENRGKETRKSGEAFRRVDAEVWNQEIIGGLENNSYESTFGADGYGFKAHKVLSTVRGKDFRHEKTKRKRSTYRGGNISLESKSFKYEG